MLCNTTSCWVFFNHSSAVRLHDITVELWLKDTKQLKVVRSMKRAGRIASAI